jgi:predicted nucleic acid-binding protein
MTASMAENAALVQQSLTFYLDASALVKRYILEDGTAWIETLCADEDNHAVAIVQIGLVEVAAAFAAKLRGHFITPAEYNQAVGNLMGDAQQRYQLVGVDQNLVTNAIQLTGRQKLRGYDAIHLAGALALNVPLVKNGLPPLIFISADNDLLAAAVAEGLNTDNPNNYA